MDLELTEIWQSLTWAAGHIGDAIKARKDDDTAPVTDHLAKAQSLANKGTLRLRQVLANLPRK